MSVFMGVSFHYLAAHAIVLIRVRLTPSQGFEIGMTPEQFFALCESIVDQATTFTAGLRERLASGSTEELKAELTEADINKLMRLKQDYEEKGSDDEKRA